MAYKYSIAFDVINGSGNHGEIDLFGFSFGGSKGQEAVGKAAGEWVVYDGKVLGDLNITKKTDLNTSKLFDMYVGGQNIASATMTVEKITGKQLGQISITYFFKNIYIDSLRYGRSGTGDELPLEYISFSFEEVRVKNEKSK